MVDAHTDMIAYNEVFVLKCSGAEGVIVVVVVIERLAEQVLQGNQQVKLYHRRLKTTDQAV